MGNINVPIKSWLQSKINWTQAISILAIGLAYFGVDLDAKTQAALIALIAAGGDVITWVLRTFFTKSVVAASVKR